MKLCNQLVISRDQLLTSQSAIVVEWRDENDQLQAFFTLYLTMVGDELKYKLDFTRVFLFRQKFTQNYQIHETSQGSLAAFLRNLEFYEEINDKNFPIRFRKRLIFYVFSLAIQ